MLTSIGSWPGVSIEDALDWAFELDLPARPELPALGSKHDMIGALLEGTTITQSAFLAKVDRLRPPAAKVQTVGPITLEVLAKRGEARLRGLSMAELESRVFARAASDVQALLRCGVQPVIYFDEPLLFAAPGETPRLSPMVRALQKMGAKVGLHSCGPMPWPEVLPCGFDQIAFDATEPAWPSPDKAALARFKARGGRLVLGAVSLSRSASLSTLQTRYGRDVDLSFSCGLAGVRPAEVPGLLLQLRGLRAGDWGL